MIERLGRPEFARVLASLHEVGFSSAIDLFGTYMAQQADVQPWLADAQINTDKNLRLQYLAGLQYNSHRYIPLSEEIRRFRWLRPVLFTGSGETLQALYRAIQNRQ